MSRVDFFINEKWSLPFLQNLSLSGSLPFKLKNSIFDTLSRTAHNLESISVEGPDGYYFEQGLQKLIQSQHQLKTITVIIIGAIYITWMSDLFKLLESNGQILWNQLFWKAATSVMRS